MTHRILTSFLLAALLPSLVWGAKCDPSDPQGTQCTLLVTEIRPTQFSVGSVAASCKAESLSEKSKKKLKSYLKKRVVPAVVGPDGNFYIADRHHLATGLFRADSPDWGESKKKLYIEIQDNYFTARVTWGKFWNNMLNSRYTYNYDNKGIPDMSFALLPTSVGDLLNDPYRTLSRWVRESCGYVKRGTDQCDGIRTDPPHEAPYFMEFYWGGFFRENLPLAVADLEVCDSIPYSSTCLADEVGALKATYEKAMELAGSEQAKSYFEDEELDPWEYGYNPTGDHLTLEWEGARGACEKPVTE